MKPKILIVDDSALVRQGTAIALDLVGFDVDQAASGVEALEMLKIGQYAAIIMDYNMPKMDGFECTGKIREMEKGSGKRVPIIGVTANTDQGIREACLAAGLDDYLDKDCTGDQLHKMVLKWSSV